MTDVSMRIMLSALGGAGVTSVIQSVAQSISGGNGIVGALGAVGIAATGAAIGLGVTAAQAAGDFQNSMEQLEAHAGLAANQVGNVTNALMKMGPEVGQGPKQLADALYPILSGFSGISNQSAKTQVSLTELNDAAKSVAGSTTSVSDVSNAATAAFNALGMQTDNTNLAVYRMNALFDEMNSTVTAGNMKWSDYSQTAGKLALSIKGTHLSFVEANSALSDLTASGYPSAQLAGDALNNLFKEMDVKVDNVAKQAGKLGLNFDETAFKTMNLGQQVQYLTQITGDDPGKLLKLMSGSDVASRALHALSTTMTTYQGNLQSIQQSAGATDQAFQTASSGWNFATQKLQAAGQVLLITIGSGLLPVLTNLANAILPVVSNFTTWISSGQATTTIMSALQPIIAYLGPLFMQLGQAVGQLGVVVLPLLVGFGQWLVTSGVLQGAITVVVVAVGLLVQGATVLINVLANVIGFFERNEVALDALRAVLILVGAVIAVSLIGALLSFGATVFTVIIPAFAAWAIGAASAGIATLIAFWPIILIVGIVILVITGVILAIQHWGEISKWLQDRWKDISAFFSGIFNDIKNVFGSIGKWFQDRFNDAKNGIQTAFGNIGGWFHDRFNDVANGVKTGYGNTSNWFQDRGKDIHNAWTDTTTKIGEGAVWLYNHNYYVKAFVDDAIKIFNQAKANLLRVWNDIVGDVETAVSWIRIAWQASVNFVVGIWQGLVGFARRFWSLLTSEVKGQLDFVVGIITFVWNWVSSFVVGIWQSLVGFARLFWKTLVDQVQEQLNIAVGIIVVVWQTISTIFSNAWNNYIAGPIGSLWNQLSSSFQGAVNDAWNFGVNLINSLVNGIKSVAGQVGKTAQDIAGDIAKYLGFHSPAEAGPGAELDQWPRNMISSYSKGLQAAIPTLQSSLNLVMAPVASTLSGSGITPSNTAPTPYAPQQSTGHTIIYAPVFNISTLARSQSEKQQLMTMINQELGSHFLTQTPGYGSGGIY